MTRKEKQVQTNEVPYKYGSQLFFNRNEFRNYRQEALRRTKIILFASGLIEKGYSPYGIASIILWETGWLSDPNARNFVVNNNNILGITLSNNRAKYFDTTYHCLDYFDKLISKAKRYTTAYQYRFWAREFLIQLNQAGYNSTTEWRNGVLNILNYIVQNWGNV